MSASSSLAPPIRSSGSSSSSTNKPPSASASTHAHAHAHIVKKGEPHRIYWQQWIATSKQNETAADTGRNDSAQQQANKASTLSRRELITSSAAVRISAAAKARDLTALLRQTLHLPPLLKKKKDGTGTTSAATATATEAAQLQQPQPQDSLVLVGTLYSLPRDYVQFEHELVQSNNGDTDGGTSSSSTTGDPFHVVQTIPSDASPLVARQRMETYLNRFLERAQQQQQQRSLFSNSAITPPPLLRPTTSRTIISPKLQWYYVPAPTTADPTTNAAASDQLLNCVELDGYCTDMDDDDDDNDHSDNQSENHGDKNGAENNYYEVDEYEDDDADDEDVSLTANFTATATTTESSTAETQENEALLEDALLLSPEEADAQWLSSQFSWFTPPPSPPPSSQQPQSQPDATNDADAVSASSATKRQKHQLRRLAREDRLFADLQREIAAASSTTSTSMSGYLLKRDARDPNVWRRVYCVLTDDHLWFVSRIYSHRQNNPATASGDSTEPSAAALCWARHGRIRLTRALLLEPNPADSASAPLVRIPYAWEIVSGQGISHVFRASSRPLQRQWITAIQEGTVQSYERSLVRSAELLIADACVARNQRTAAVAVEPLWDKIVECNKNDNNSIEAIKIGRHVQAVLRLGLQVADYRECCRYLQSVLLNTSNPMAVAAPQPPPPSRFGGSLLRSASSSSSSLTVPRMDTTTHDMIHAAWDRAAALLVRATHVGLTVQQHHSVPKAAAASAAEPPKLSHSVDTLCRHIDYVITGRFRRHQHNPAAAIGGTNRARTVSNDADHEFQPPPTDLFDRLLDELQIEAVAADDAITKKDVQKQWLGSIETTPTLLT